MKTKASHYKLLTLVIMAGFCLFACQQSKRELPVINPSDINPALVDHSVQIVSQNHQIADFSLINQNGNTVTGEDFKDKVYVTDFFFTRCPSICPIMTDNMEKLQTEFLNDTKVMFLSISVTPELDSISVLRDYANNKGVIDGKWHVTTGDKRHIYNLARKSFFAVSDKGDGGLQDFIHTPNFILVDQKRQIRGIYDGTKDSEIIRIKDDISLLIQKDVHSNP